MVSLFNLKLRLASFIREEHGSAFGIIDIKSPFFQPGRNSAEIFLEFREHLVSLLVFVTHGSVVGKNC